MFKIAKFSAYLQLSLVVLSLAGGVGGFIYYQHRQIEQVTKDKNDLNDKLTAEQAKSKSLAQTVKDNRASFQIQLQIERDNTTIALAERDKALKRAQSYSTIRANIANAKPSDRDTPVSPVIIDTIDQIWKDN